MNFNLLHMKGSKSTHCHWIQTPGTIFSHGLQLLCCHTAFTGFVYLFQNTIMHLANTFTFYNVQIGTR